VFISVPFSVLHPCKSVAELLLLRSLFPPVNIFMQFLDLTLPLPEENVALDTALLDACEAGEIGGEVLRLWEPDKYFVVLGRSSDPAVEVNLAACRQKNIPILRRASGGGTILAGPGCLMYAVVLRHEGVETTRSITHCHQHVLSRMVQSLSPLVPGVRSAGTSDLAFQVGDSLQKFSGNALRMKREFYLYHGTLLYDFDLDLVSELLASQTREPIYRANRAHGEFIANLPTTREQLTKALTTGWGAREPITTWPRERMVQIMKTNTILQEEAERTEKNI
jgi:lipoate-protein ligase A